MVLIIVLARLQMISLKKYDIMCGIMDIYNIKVAQGMSKYDIIYVIMLI